jgi:hypothetical protein
LTAWAAICWDRYKGRFLVVKAVKGEVILLDNACSRDLIPAQAKWAESY